MVLLAISLRMGWVKLRWVEDAANVLTANLGFFFIPAGVGVMRCFDLISRDWAAIVTATVVSTFIIIAVTGHVHQLVRRWSRHHS